MKSKLNIRVEGPHRPGSAPVRPRTTQITTSFFKKSGPVKSSLLVTLDCTDIVFCVYTGATVMIRMITISRMRYSVQCNLKVRVAARISSFLGRGFQLSGGAMGGGCLSVLPGCFSPLIVLRLHSLALCARSSPQVYRLGRSPPGEAPGGDEGTRRRH